MKTSRWSERLAVCSWSLQPAGPKELVEAVKQTLEIAGVVEHVRIDAQQGRAGVRPYIDRPLT